MLFLDEIGELGLDEQAMILRAIEDKRFLPVGSDKEAASEFQLIAGTNRDLGEVVSAARTVRFSKKELIWLAGNSFYGKQQMFAPDFIAWLADYQLRTADGQFELTFDGPWTHTTMWEIPALAIVNELRSRAALKGKGRFELDILYARAKAKLWGKVERLAV